jgi:hypothetical protein
VAPLGASWFVITITSILERKATKDFTELKGDRSHERGKLARTCGLRREDAKCGQNWRARQGSNLRPSV